MNYPVNFSDLKISIVILCTLVFFYVYYYLSHSEYLKRQFQKEEKTTYEVKLFISRKLLGFTILGIIPGLLYFSFLRPNISFIDFFTGEFPSGIYIILILVSIIILLTFINQKSNSQRSSLQMNITEWTPYLFGINAIGWILYLFGYEFLFRGILLFESYESFGFWPAIAINVVIYSAIHMINSKDEAIGALLFGTIACYFTLQQGTILIPLVMHIALSLSSDYFSIRMNKGLKFVKP